MQQRVPDVGLRIYVMNSLVEDERTGRLRWLLNLPVCADTGVPLPCATLLSLFFQRQLRGVTVCAVRGCCVLSL